MGRNRMGRLACKHMILYNASKIIENSIFPYFFCIFCGQLLFPGTKLENKVRSLKFYIKDTDEWHRSTLNYNYKIKINDFISKYFIRHI